MRIGIVKPDYGIAGGFEAVMARVEQELEARGHTVEWQLLDVAGVDRRAFGLDVPERVWAQAWEAFRYLALVDRFANMDASHVDLVISTQPPSFAIDHPRQLALFSHHHRIYYDLSEVYVRAGFVDPELHERAQRAVRRVDAFYLARPGYILAASEEVQRRLAVFNGLSDVVGVYHAGNTRAEHRLQRDPTEGTGYALCVTRHEFPKRAELFVHAMKYMPAMTGLCVGTGGRLAFTKAVDARLSAAGIDLDSLSPHDLWLNRGEPDGIAASAVASNVRFPGFVSDDELVTLYDEALCVVAPAYLEDYGLTALEAMAAGKPLIVCRDGGGLAHFVNDGVTGYIVEPTGRAIADAVQQVASDRGLARRLGEAARARAREYSWDRAMQEIGAGIERVCG